ncbi:MAG: hypothetical protein ACTSRS_06425 [Candidatus Helarchaeota archaeon]
MKLKKGIYPLIGLLLMIFLTLGNAVLLVQSTGDGYYLLLALAALPLFLAIIYVWLFKLDQENAD